MTHLHMLGSFQAAGIRLLQASHMRTLLIGGQRVDRVVQQRWGCVINAAPQGGSFLLGRGAAAAAGSSPNQVWRACPGVAEGTIGLLYPCL